MTVTVARLTVYELIPPSLSASDPLLLYFNAERALVTKRLAGKTIWRPSAAKFNMKRREMKNYLKAKHSSIFFQKRFQKLGSKC